MGRAPSAGARVCITALVKANWLAPATEQALADAMALNAARPAHESGAISFDVATKPPAKHASTIWKVSMPVGAIILASMLLQLTAICL